MAEPTKPTQPTPGLGRVYIPDERDQAYPLSALLRAEPTPVLRHFRYHSTFWPPLDQGATSQCVAYSLVGHLYSSPIRHPRTWTTADLAALYRRAQELDEWPGREPAYFGTSVRAGCKALQEKGLVSGYYWAQSLDDIIAWLLRDRPLILGVAWYSSFDAPGADGVLHITDGAYIRGGHALLAYGVNTKKRLVRVQNSWGERWGTQLGRGWFPFDVLERLVFQEPGEAVAVLEVER